jgi:HD-like signal output (HDOD) protein
MMQNFVLVVIGAQKTLDGGLREAFSTLESSWPVQYHTDVEAGLRAAQGIPKVVVAVQAGREGDLILQRTRKEVPHAVRVKLEEEDSYGLRSEASLLAHLTLGKPWNGTAMQRLVQRATSLIRFNVDPVLRNVLDGANTLPSMPETYWRLMDVLEQENVTPRQVADVLRLDVAMTAKILVLTNSAYFRKGVMVTTVERCLTILGFNLFRLLAASTFVFKILGDRCSVAQEFNFRQFDAQANLVARTTKRMLINPFLVQEAYTVGLLHDIGSLVLATCLPSTYDEIATDVRLHGMPRREAEIDHLGTPASTLGAYVMTLWGMPDELVDIIQAHDAPMESLRGVGSELRPTLQLASQLISSARTAERARMPLENPFGWLEELDATGASRSPNALLGIAQEEWQEAQEPV